jgi:hypothetical protein
MIIYVILSPTDVIIHWEILLNDFCPLYVLMRCRLDVVHFFKIFLSPPRILMPCSFFEKIFYFFYVTVFVHIFVQYIKYKNDEQPRPLILII